MTLRSIIAATLQLAGVFLFCNVLGAGMGFLSFRSTAIGQTVSADWAKIWTFNMAFWSVGIGLALILIFAAGPLASFLCKIAANRPDAVISSGSVSSEVVVQVFAGFLLVRETYGALNQLVWIFTSFEAMQVMVMVLYYGTTIGLSIWLLRYPEALARFRKQPLPSTFQGE